jgi:hypothetical protein
MRKTGALIRKGRSPVVASVPICRGPKGRQGYPAMGR